MFFWTPYTFSHHEIYMYIYSFYATVSSKEKCVQDNMKPFRQVYPECLKRRNIYLLYIYLIYFINKKCKASAGKYNNNSCSSQRDVDMGFTRTRAEGGGYSGDPIPPRFGALPPQRELLFYMGTSTP